MLKSGVYLDHNRRSAIAVRTNGDTGPVVYLTMNPAKLAIVEGRPVYETTAEQVTLVTASAKDFARQFCVYLPDYPVLRACKTYWRSGLRIEPEAKKVLAIVIKNLSTKARSVA